MKKIENKILDYDELDERLIGHRVADGYSYVVRFEDGKQIEIIGRHGILTFNQVGAELNKAYAFGVDHGKAMKTAQIESCEPTEPINLNLGTKLEPMPIVKDSDKSTGYHLQNIPKGLYGDLSKVREEFHELADAYEQNSRIMVLHELSDLYGAIEAFLDNEFEGKINMDDVKQMSDITKRAFASGERK